ncbi:hypothetical protein K2173_011934 [Erythroxylum novogranatense]|uniref:Casein kinase substrate phosphoprotein PP28 domain-containing protein n=1 Tax=Erythroxylum novogranatense TaxID=1862640 RepID=A0AAV8TGV6_9ROSI|nr:hypothetical protein K2173_011934 [Erythroxylum novogranatense]
MGKGKFKSKPTGRRHFSSPEELLAFEARSRTFKQEDVVQEKEEEESEEEVEREPEKRKGIQGLIQVQNPNTVERKNLKGRDDVGKAAEPSRREREEIEKAKARERYMRLQEQGKTEQAKKDLERLAMIRQERAEAARKREAENAAKVQKKMEKNAKKKGVLVSN